MEFSDSQLSNIHSFQIWYSVLAVTNNDINLVLIYTHKQVELQYDFWHWEVYSES